jgi:hypothetical protein
MPSTIPQFTLATALSAARRNHRLGMAMVPAARNRETRLNPAWT